jgi:hypothetical protein
MYLLFKVIAGAIGASFLVSINFLLGLFALWIESERLKRNSLFASVGGRRIVGRRFYSPNSGCHSTVRVNRHSLFNSTARYAFIFFLEKLCYFTMRSIYDAKYTTYR